MVSYIIDNPFLIGIIIIFVLWALWFVVWLFKDDFKKQKAETQSLKEALDYCEDCDILKPGVKHEKE